MNPEKETVCEILSGGESRASHGCFLVLRNEDGLSFAWDVGAADECLQVSCDLVGGRDRVDSCSGLALLFGTHGSRGRHLRFRSTNETSSLS